MVAALAMGFYSPSCETYKRSNHHHRGDRHRRFYSLSCETYRRTSPTAYHIGRDYFVSIRCRARRTGERPAPPRTVLTSCFYSLSCETYRRTPRRSTHRGALGRFLFAVVRDVQANSPAAFWPPRTTPRFYSLSCETYRRKAASWTRRRSCLPRFYSLSCETYRRTSPRRNLGGK